MCMICMGRHTCNGAFIGSEDSLGESVLSSLLYMGSGNWTQVARLTHHLYLKSQLSDSRLLCY